MQGGGLSIASAIRDARKEWPSFMFKYPIDACNIACDRQLNLVD